MILNWHEIVNDNIGGKEVVVTYCPLCGSGLVFGREVGDRLLSFGNTGALYESAMVMYDRETESYWWQVGGLALKGPLEGEKLQLLPSTISTWEEWLTIHPNSVVLSRNTGYSRDYDFDPFDRYDRKDSPPAFPVSGLDDRLPPKERVIGISVNGEAKAYPIFLLGDSVTMDSVGGVDVLIISKASSFFAAAFEADLDGSPLEFFMEDGRIMDRSTNSVWSSAGIAIEGPLKGLRLTPIPNASEFWFAWAIAHPDTEIGGF